VNELNVIRQVADLRAVISGWRRAEESIGLLPTMGALHEGHLTLVRRAKADCRRVVATIFVNPTQFGPSEDVTAYPRDEAGDRALLQGTGTDLLFAPTAEEMYPPGFATTVTVGGLTEHLCGPHRPGHFAGVATVVTKLLAQSLPTRAYFGEKDFQQLQVIRHLVRDLDLPVEIVGVPTVREADGLALSSRNRHLSKAERQCATVLPALLRNAAVRLADGRVASPEIAAIEQGLRDSGFGPIDYVTLADEATLVPLCRAAAPCRLFAAVRLGPTRLIDNWPVA
jgi:pantoate--beta-alanine ligase